MGGGVPAIIPIPGLAQNTPRWCSEIADNLKSGVNEPKVSISYVAMVSQWSPEEAYKYTILLLP